MLQTAQSSKASLPSIKTTLSGKAQAQAIAKGIAKQIADEPFEILKGATEQLIGGPPPSKQAADQAPQGVPGADLGKIRRKEAFHMQAFREEIKHIQELKLQRAQGFQESKQQTEQQQQEKEQDKAEAAPVEAPGKAKKGGMMQGAKKKVSNMLEAFRSKKSRSIETQKMPSN